MIALANLFNAIALLIDSVLLFLVVVVVLRVIVSWVNADPFNPIVRFLSASTDPFLQPIRRYVRPIGGVLDITPIILLLLLTFLRAWVPVTISDYAQDMKARYIMTPR